MPRSRVTLAIGFGARRTCLGNQPQRARDVDAALAAAVQAGGKIAHPPMEIPGHGTFAIYHQGGNDHGLWQF
jgi:predicted enzyme related to lactoylglutathione lyase